MRVLVLIALSSCCACGGTLPTPRIAEVSPSQVRANVATPITIRLDGVLPTRMDYVGNTVSADNEVTVFINDLQIAKTRMDSSRTLQATLPANLEPKSYDLIVTFGDGRQALSGGAITVNR